MCAYIHAQNKCTYLRYVIAKIKKRKRRFFKAFLNEIKEYYFDFNIMIEYSQKVKVVHNKYVTKTKI